MAATADKKTNSFFLKDKKPKAEIPNSGVIYELLDLRRNADGEPLCPSSFTIPPEDEIWDENNQNLLPHEYIVGTTPKKGENNSIINLPVKGDIVFEFGQLIVFPKDVKLFRYLEKSNYNNSNPNRRTELPALFKRIDTAGDKIKQALKNKSILEALKFLEDMTEEETLRYAAALNIQTEYPSLSDEERLDAIKVDLEVIARTKPKEFINDFKDSLRDAKAIINLAIRASIIQFVPGIHKYFWKKNKDTQDMPIVQVPKGHADHVGWFAKWLITEGRETYELLQDKVADSN